MTYFRFEIEKKLKAAKRKEQHKKKHDSHKVKKESKDKSSKDWSDKDLDKDAKERSKERKKMVEENKGKTDKKAQAMHALKAKREEKKERGLQTINNLELVLLIPTVLLLK